MTRVLWIVLLGLVACGQGDTEAADESYKADPPIRVAPGPGENFSVAGVEFTAPSGWLSVPPSGSMRKASFEIGAVGTDEERAELHVFYFGPSDGGGIDANIDRWLGQIQPAVGASTDAEPERGFFTASGYPVHIVRADGNYAQSVGAPMSGNTVDKAGWRLVGAIVEGAQGSIFFKLTGPQATVRAAEPGLEEMLKSLNKQRE